MVAPLIGMHFLSFLILPILSGFAAAVLGHWFGPVMLWNIYIISALIGVFASGFGLTACHRVSARVMSQKETLREQEHRTAG
ncbi:MAG: hypothetical protein M1423_05595 [Acidobacteria bacterium]|nr:hypothetical protein [Acidobacteriota bacterium]